MLPYASACKSYDRFKMAVRSNAKCFTTLNPIDGKIGGLDGPLGVQVWSKEKEKEKNNQENEAASINETMEILLRAGVIQCIVIFEAYLHDLLAEAFDEVCSSASTFRICQNIFAEKKHGNYDSLDQFRNKTISDVLKQPTIYQMKKCIEALFYGKETNLNPFFEMMFTIKKFEIVWQIPEEDFLGITPKPNFYSARLSISDLKTVTHLLNLFYGIRCISAHGNPAATMSGCLKNFKLDELKFNIEKVSGVPKPSGNSQANIETFQLPPDLIKKYFNAIFEEINRVIKDNSSMKINYHLYLNINKFMMCLAQNLMYVIGCLIYKLQDKFLERGEKFWHKCISEWDKLMHEIDKKAEQKPQKESKAITTANRCNTLFQ